MYNYFEHLSLIQKIRYFYNFYRFRQIYKKDRKSIEKWQEARLRDLIPVLEKNIPMFAEILQAANIRVSDIKSLADLSKLPVINKDIFRNRPVSDYTISTFPPVGTWVTTSGTSGMPFTAIRRIISWLPFYRDFMQYRFLMEERPWSLDAEWARMVYLRVLPINRKNLLLITAEKLFSQPERAIREIIDFDPYFIEGHASFLEEFARKVQELGIGPKPKYALSASERLYPATRKLIEEQLHCVLYNRYGLEEFGTVGIDCTAHDGFHIYVESCIVEVVDTQGNPVPEGESGKIIITDLYNYEMPYIRYDTGDRGYISWEKCMCGLESQRLWITGRYSAALTFGQRKYHQFEFSELMQSFAPFIFRYLIVKRSDFEMEARLIPTASYNKHVHDEIQKKLKTLMGPSIEVTLSLVESIPRLPRGKSKIVLDESAGV